MIAINSTPFSLRIFVADGDPDGLRIVEKSNWIGKALVFPRALLPQVKARPELAQTGVYLLLGPRPDGEGDMLYVGEGDSNGRVARLLAMLMGLQAGVPPLDFAPLDGRHKPNYIGSIHAALARDYVPLTRIFEKVIVRTWKLHAASNA
jgi:hypothetical protein